MGGAAALGSTSRRVLEGAGRPVLVVPDASPGALARADVQIAVDLGQDLRLRGRGLDTLLKGRLNITTPGGELAVNGTIYNHTVLTQRA